MQTFGEYVVKPANTYVLVPTGNTFSFLLTCGGRGPRSRRVYSLNANPTPYQDLEGGEQNGEACDSKTAATVAMGAAGALGLTYIIAPAFFTAEGFAAAIDFVMRPTAEEQCENGLLIPGPMPSLFNVFFYMALLLWSFAGVAIAADIFMVAIEYITSQTSTKLLQTQHGVKPMTVYIWNATVANLTLMALGSSAPEILLSIIEIVSSGCYAGALGPSTIVGSAAFNLLGISTVCVLAIPAGQTRYVKEVPVFFCTAFFSVFAYAWLYFILVVCTPNIVDIWEGMATLLLFPLLVLLAYFADIKVCATKVGENEALPDVNKYGKGVSKDDVVLALKNSGYETQDIKRIDPAVLSSVLSYALAPASRAFYRVNAIRTLSAGKAAEHDDPSVQAALETRGKGLSDGSKQEPTIGFEFSALTVQEGGKYATLRVMLSYRVAHTVTAHYETVSETATAGEDYVAASGVLVLAPGLLSKEVRISIIDDDEAEDDETFSVVLTKPSGAKLNQNHTCTVTIEDDDMPGVLSFAESLVTCAETCGTLNLTVKRSNGSKGRIACEYTTRDGTAVSPSDYVSVSGTLVFESGIVEQTVSIPIVDDARYEMDEQFQLILTEPDGGASFDTEADGYPDRACCTITIHNDHGRAETVDNISKLLDLNVDNIQLAADSWADQFVEAVTFAGGGFVGALLYLLTLPWKLIFAFVPPPRLAGGWLCFCVALIGIGGLTALIGDLASHMGCCMGLLPSVTAITFVALGTSLPDTFASAQAAVKEIYADSSIGNITGSNSVNVFLGLGLPWAVAAIYWSNPTEAAAASWRARYAGESWYDPAMPIGFAVPAGDLGFSVGVFCTTAVFCLATLFLRRAYIGAELGGPMGLRYVTAAFFLLLWACYIGFSALNAYGVPVLGMPP